MKNKSRFYLALMSALWLSHSFANEPPKTTNIDPPIKVIHYQENRVINIQGTHLIATTIQFGKDETIISSNIGDSIAWLIEAQQNLLTLKPVLPSSDTNLLVITNQHVYPFHLVTKPTFTPQSKSKMYLLKFKYEDDIKNQDKTSLLLQQVERNTFDNTQPYDEAYSYVGLKDMAPIKAFDNGEMTFFKFHLHQMMPAIFIVDSAQNERLANFRIQGAYVVISGVHPQYTLRNGDDVTTIYKDHDINLGEK